MILSFIAVNAVSALILRAEHIRLRAAVAAGAVFAAAWTLAFFAILL